MLENSVLTIGHSTHPQDRFISLLREHAISAVCDVRSQPYSRVNPQFNREQLKEQLKVFGIRYVFLGRTGSTKRKRCLLQRRQGQYDRLAQTELFRHGLQRVETE